ncbi:5'-nucleotidase SurE [Commensalibacter sp. Nvir]|uniref:5'/3'-nucleotidase SurE n=1 Tax=Commensalibacter sp. Nvir TaxID=3069817 RepID=UPI002D70DFE3|nr:5'-nucleotidase SurE [Commensalibacter sp. Nvir]
MVQIYKRLLLTNDDGIDSPGLKILEEISHHIADEFWVVAPEKDQSGTSQSVSMHNPLRVIKKDDRHFSISGTPSDCVVMGLKHLLPFQPDAVFSGINKGSNLGLETLFSGTVGAAMTSSLLGVPSIALSQNYQDGHEVLWQTSSYHLPDLLGKIFDCGCLKDDMCLNINIPDCCYNEVKSICFTSQGTGYLNDIQITKRIDTKNNSYYWLRFERPYKQDDDNTEAQTINQQSISITPLAFDRTNKDLLTRLNQLNIKIKYHD